MPTPKKHPYKRPLMRGACLAAVLGLGVGLIEVGLIKFGPVGMAAAVLAAGPAPSPSASRLVTLNFPPVPVAVLELGDKAPDGRGGITWQVQKVVARGKVQIPASAAIMLHLRYEGLEHINTLAQLNHAQVQQLQITDLDLDDSQFAFFKIFPNICRLNLDSTLVTDKSLATIASFKKLFDLRLSKVDVSGDGMEALDGLPLHSLNFSGSSLVAGNLAKIKSLPATLLSLNCSATHIGKADIAFLAKCQKIESLDISRNKILDDSCIPYLANLPHLQNLLIADTAITDASLPTLAKMAGLKRLVVRPRTFWKKGSGKSPRPDLTIVDATDDSRTPIDVFGPLH